METKELTMNEALLKCCEDNSKAFDKDKKVFIANSKGNILVSYKNYDDLTSSLKIQNDLKFSDCVFKYDGYLMILAKQDNLDLGLNVKRSNY